ncbi:hypothetical protein POVCU2_0016250 [Plasmodium ovale curtisi]|uniref:Uncharacterized protein n=1 Tax=Plasmodium ovale curtisi TaxID=864141 RepID=A0A1A8W8E4_PLAOA|nr:hypothetical protein POVCU2_0016250 [Plasmodium ovale curtisi]SBS87458.1 hypothetical protein POVCU1_014590 [Plasmodium ovale curtisi]
MSRLTVSKGLRRAHKGGNHCEKKKGKQVGKKNSSTNKKITKLVIVRTYAVSGGGSLPLVLTNLIIYKMHKAIRPMHNYEVENGYKEDKAHLREHAAAA